MQTHYGPRWDLTIPTAFTSMSWWSGTAELLSEHLGKSATNRGTAIQFTTYINITETQPADKSW